MIYGIGIDLVDVARIEKMLAKWGDAFIRRIYSTEEIGYCREKTRPSLHYAACFAVKEAFLKAMGTGLGGGISLTDISTVHRAGGKPEVMLYGEASALLHAEKMATSVSISHTDDLATAIVMIHKEAGQSG